jgi:hypothetical protein
MAVTEAKKRLQADRKSKGLCIACGEPANGKTRCVACATRAKTSRQKTAEKKKSLGICQMSGCTNTAMPDRTVCVTCSEKASKHSSDRYSKNKEAGVCRECGKPSNGKSRCPEHEARFKAWQTAQYQLKKDMGLCTNCGVEDAQVGLTQCAACNVDKNAKGRRRWLHLKLAAFAAYGGAVCVGCGEDEAEILEIDHVNGGGNQHRKDIGQSNMYLWLKQNDYPDGYRVLCPTCNKKAHKQLPLPFDTN